VRACDLCQWYGARPPASKKDEHVNAERVGQKWVADIVYLPAETEGMWKGCDAALTLVDVKSRWHIMRPILTSATKEAENSKGAAKGKKATKKAGAKKQDMTEGVSSEMVAYHIMSAWHEAGVHFVPEEIVHDNGSEFKKVFQRVCELINVEQHWSVASRPTSHGIVEKFNRDVCNMIGKRGHKSRTVKPHEDHWTWSCIFAVAAANSAPRRSLSKGLQGFSPSEVFHGMVPVLPLDRLVESENWAIAGQPCGIEPQIEACRSMQKRAVAWVTEAKRQYEKELENDMRNKFKTVRQFQEGDIVLRHVKVKGVERKVVPTYEDTLFVIVARRHAADFCLQPIRQHEAEAIWDHADNIKKANATPEDVEDAAEQARVAREKAEDQWEVEAIIDHKGLKKDGSRQVRIKWKGFGLEESTWHYEAEVDNKDLLAEYFSRKKKSAAVVAVSSMDVKRIKPGRVFIKADLTAVKGPSLVQAVCKEVGICPSRVVLVWASPPCRTFSHAPYNISPGHGPLFRKFDHEERPPCCESDDCEFAALSRLHDTILPRLQQSFAADRKQGYTYEFAVEQPRNCMLYRPYAQLHNWPAGVQVQRQDFDMCNFAPADEPAPKKASCLWTSLMGMQLKGKSGYGKCGGQCLHGEWCPQTGKYRHELAIAQEAARRPKGKQRVGIPQGLISEVLDAAVQTQDPRDVVVDLFCGYQTIRKEVERRGLNYIGIDMCDILSEKASLEGDSRLFERRDVGCVCTAKGRVKPTAGN